MSEVQKQPSKTVKLPIASISQEELEAQLPDLMNWAACNPNKAELKFFRDRAVSQMTVHERSDIRGTLSGVFSLLAGRITGKQEAQEGLNGKRFEVVSVVSAPKVSSAQMQEEQVKETASQEAETSDVDTPDTGDLLIQLEIAKSFKDLEAFKDVMVGIGRWEEAADGAISVTNKGDANSAWQKNKARNEALFNKWAEKKGQIPVSAKEKAILAKQAEKQRKEEELQNTRQELEIDGAKVEVGYYIKDNGIKVYKVLNVEGECSIKAGISGRFDGLPPALRYVLDSRAAQEIDQKSAEVLSERLAEQTRELTRQWEMERRARRAKRQEAKAAKGNDKKSKGRNNNKSRNRGNGGRKAA